MSGDDRSEATQATSSSPAVFRAELPNMLATLCSYENCFGPRHPLTLRLMVQIAVAHWRSGAPGDARPMLEKAARDVARFLGPEHDLRLQALAALRDLFVARGDYDGAGAVQGELLERHIQRLGRDHPETAATRSNLATILLKKTGRAANRAKCAAPLTN